MKIDPRLKECAAKVTGRGLVCDVGTDHAYLPVYLVLEGLCREALACDLNQGPLKAAAQTVQKYQLKDKIRLIQSDGLDDVPPEGITDVIFAGMGAELICRLISRAKWLENGVNLILQPMTRIPVLRRWLYENGFEIKEETAVESDGFCYSVMRAEYCGVFRQVDEVFAHTGKLDLTVGAGKEFGLRLKRRILQEAEGIMRSDPDSERGKELKTLAEQIGAKLEEK